jgi:branched-chain amino acid transport system permease protein
MTGLIQAITDGLLLGGVYGLLAVGLSLVFGVLGILNFAHAEFIMVGMYTAWIAWRWLGLDPLLGAFLSFAVGFGMGVVIERLLVARVLRGPPVAQMFLTVGLLIMMENGALLIFGSELRSVHTPYQADALDLGPIFVSVPFLLAFAAAVLVSLGLWLVMTRTWLGLAIRATAQNRMAATAFGIDTGRIYSIAFGLGTGLTAFGGGIVLPYTAVNPTSGAQFVILIFTVVVLGGLGSTLGALVGGLMVGVIQSLSTLVLPIQLQNLALFVIFILLLVAKPSGLLGRMAR